MAPRGSATPRDSDGTQGEWRLATTTDCTGHSMLPHQLQRRRFENPQYLPLKDCNQHCLAIKRRGAAYLEAKGREIARLGSHQSQNGLTSLPAHKQLTVSERLSHLKSGLPGDRDVKMLTWVLQAQTPSSNRYSELSYSTGDSRRKSTHSNLDCVFSSC